MTPMKRRARAAQACIDRFAGKPFDPSKKCDCVQLAKHAFHHLGRRVGQGKMPAYSTATGAVRAMQRSGHRDLVAAVDAFGLERIPPAAALAGDIVALPTDDEVFGAALCVAVGNGRVLGFHEGICAVLEPHAFLAAWRAI